MEKKNGNEWEQRIIQMVKYQKMAVQALLPQQVSVHMQVIEDEVKAMLMELAIDMFKNTADVEDTPPKKVKKVTIE